MWRHQFLAFSGSLKINILPYFWLIDNVPVFEFSHTVMINLLPLLFITKKKEIMSFSNCCNFSQSATDFTSMKATNNNNNIHTITFEENCWQCSWHSLPRYISIEISVDEWRSGKICSQFAGISFRVSQPRHLIALIGWTYCTALSTFALVIFILSARLIDSLRVQAV